MIAVDIEAMNESFAKFHLRGLPCHAVLHRFTAPDRGDPHDHPWGFTSFVLAGGYVEEVFDALTGRPVLIRRRPGESFRVAARHIHRIVELPAGECWTLVLPGPQERTSGFWRFGPDGAEFRRWHEAAFSPVNSAVPAPDSDEQPRETDPAEGRKPDRAPELMRGPEPALGLDPGGAAVAAGDEQPREAE